MGLLYILPISEDERDRLGKNPKTGALILKSYGLPLIFWGYLLGILTITSAMGLAIRSPLIKLYETGDTINQVLALSCLTTLIAVPLGFLFFLFYEYRLEKKGAILKKSHHLFGLRLWQKTISVEEFLVDHFMDSPNMAKLYGNEDQRGFQNKGHFLLKARDVKGAVHLIDRSSKKMDLTKLKTFLEQA